MTTGKLVSPAATKFYVPPPKDELRQGFAYSGYSGRGKDLSPQWTYGNSFTWYKYGGEQLKGEVVYVVRFQLPASIPWAASGKRTLIQW